MQSQTPSHGIGLRTALGLSVLPTLQSPTPVTADSVLLALASQGATCLHLPAIGLPGLVDGLAKLAAEPRAPLQVVAIDAELGAIALGRPQAALAQLAALDKEESRTAVSVTESALRTASSLSARYVRVRLGEVAGLDRLWRNVRAHFLRGAGIDDSEPGDELLQARSALVPRHLDSVRRAIEQLSNAAVHANLSLLLTYPRRATELPLPIELRLLLEEFEGAPIAPSLDLPAAHLSSMMRLVSLPESVRTFAKGPLHCIGDAAGPIGALPPGSGEVDVAAVCRVLPKDATLSFMPWPGLSFREVMTGLQSLTRLHPAHQVEPDTWPSSPIPANLTTPPA